MKFLIVCVCALVATCSAANLERSKRGIYGESHGYSQGWNQGWNQAYEAPHHVHHEHVRTVHVPIPIVKHVPVEKLIVKKLIERVPEPYPVYKEIIKHVPVDRVVVKKVVEHVPQVIVKKIIEKVPVPQPYPVEVVKHVPIHVPVPAHDHHDHHDHFDHHDHHHHQAEELTVLVQNEEHHQPQGWVEQSNGWADQNAWQGPSASGWSK